MPRPKGENIEGVQTPAGEVDLFCRWMGWTPSDLAGWLRVSDTTVAVWRSGRANPPVAVTYLLRMIMRHGMHKIGGPVYEHEVFKPVKRRKALR